MTFTNFRNGITSLGVPVLPSGLIPFGPTSKAYFVAPGTGSDGNRGTDPTRPLATLAEAHSLCTANNNDVVFLMAQSNTASATTDYQSATLTWSKDLTHLIGIGAPGHFSQRARIGQLSTATGVSPLVNVTANGCLFANFSVFHGVADATSLVALQVTGARNYFYGSHIAGMGDATMVTAGAASLKLAGASENTFSNCVIGLDTISRDNTTNGEIWCTSGASRNWFEDCLIDAYISNAGYAHLTIGTNGIDRGLYFKNSLFMAKSTNKAITQTQVMSIPAISQGAIVLQDTYAFSDGGTVKWDNTGRGIIWNNAVAAEAAANGGIMSNL
jgi:hypothetical protein